MSTKPKLDSTTDYDIFDLHELNRDLHGDPRLEESMRKHGFRPSGAIHVRMNGNGKYKVIRGHNRLSVAMKLNLPIWFIVDNDDLSIYEWEGSTTPLWNAEDFATSYAHGGSEDCRQLLAFRNKHGLNLGSAASLFGGQGAASNNKIKELKAGKFKMGNLKHALSVVRITDTCRDLGVAFATSSGFVSAVSAALLVPEFDADVFLSRVNLYPRMMSRRTSKADYLTEIEALYNYGAKSKRLALAIRAHEVGLARKASFGKSNG